MNALVYVDIEQGIYKGENVELMEQIVFFWTTVYRNEWRNIDPLCLIVL